MADAELEATLEAKAQRILYADGLFRGLRIFYLIRPNPSETCGGQGS